MDLVFWVTEKTDFATNTIPTGIEWCRCSTPAQSAHIPIPTNAARDALISVVAYSANAQVGQSGEICQIVKPKMRCGEIP
jgi:hypothetical protein